MLCLSPIGYIYVLTLPLPISYNTYAGRVKSQTSKRGRIWRDETVETIYRQCGGKPEPLVGRCAIYWELWMPDDRRKRDPDNHTGKHVLDAIVRAGIIPDDHAGFVTEEHKYMRGKHGKGCLVVTAMEI